jgi:hypothetical protein
MHRITQPEAVKREGKIAANKGFVLKKSLLRTIRRRPV